MINIRAKHYRKSIIYLACFLLFLTSFLSPIALAASNNANLSDIVLNGISIDEFEANTLIYNVEVDWSTTEMTLEATAEIASATIVGDVGTNTLIVGLNTFEITCTSEDSQLQQTYTINITRCNASTDATLSDLTLNDTTVSGFISDTYTYDISVNDTTGQIDVGATATDDNAQITGNTGTQSLTVGQNTLTVSCTAEDGVTTQDYVLNITREVPTSSADATLSNLTIDGTTIEGFISNTYAYDITVDYLTDEIVIGATVTDDNAQITGDIGTKNLAVGLNVLTVTCTAQDDETSQEYVLNIMREETTRDAFTTDATLSDLTIDGTTVQGFASDTYTYDITIDYNTEQVDIGATANDSNAQITGKTGTQSLAVGLNALTVTCTAQDSVTSQDYVLNITRESGGDDTSSLESTDNNGLVQTEWVNGRLCVKGEVLIKLRNTRAGAIDQSLSALEVSSFEKIGSSNVVKAHVPKGKSVKSYIDEISAQSNVEYIQPNYIYILETSVNDPYTINDYQWHHDTINSYGAWDMTMGDPAVVVAVLDTGVDLDHPDLSIYRQTDVVDNDGSAEDDNGHGTHVSGLVGATANNGMGVAGVAPGVKLMVVDIFLTYDDNGEPAWGAASEDVVEGINYAVSNGADVMNLSIGSYTNDTAQRDAIDSAVSQGVVVVCSAGNDDTDDLHYPSDYDSAISVIATNRLDQRSSFSNYGAEKDIAAPGGEIPASGTDDVPYEGMVSTYIDGYAIMSGTSQASPVVAGVCALILSTNPDLTVDEVKDVLYQSAVDLGATGKDTQFGHGRVNAYAAVNLTDATYNVSEVQLDNSTLDIEVGLSETLVATVLPATAKNKNVHWTSSNENIATVENGVVTAVSEGSVTITATSEDGGHSDSCTVTVKAHADFYTFDASTETITGYTGKATNLVIPNSIGGVMVTAIGNNAFDQDDDVETITIPDSVTSIGQSSFKDCINLETVTLGNSVETIGPAAFMGCTDLTSVNLPDSLTLLGDGMFYNCTSLTSIDIPQGIQLIDDSFFYNCTSLTSVIIPNTVTYIGLSSFYNCDGLVSITIPNGVEHLAVNCFSACDALISITIPTSVTFIGDGAFLDHNSNLVIYGVTGSYAETYANTNGIAFVGLSTDATLSDISIDGTTIDGFDSTTYSYDMDVDNTTAQIDISAIAADINAEITGDVGINTLSLGLNTFTITCTAEDGVTTKDYILNITRDNNGTPEGIVFDKATGTITDYTGNATTLDIPSSIDGVTVSIIGYEAFYRNSSITSLTIPDSVTSIEDRAFYWCPNLASVTIGGGDIGTLAFYRCENLTSLTIGSNVTNIGENSFRDCSGLINITIPSNILSIGTGAFRECSGLESVTLENGIISIGEFAFYLCTSLSNIDIPSSISVIGDHAFRQCESLTSITLPNSITTIGDYLFCYCTSLTNITIPSSVTTIETFSFFNCNSLSSITIGDNITSIGESAFKMCSSLTSITIGKGLDTIGELIFEECTNLTEVVVDADNNSFKSIDGVLFDKPVETLLYYPMGHSRTLYDLPNTVVTINPYVFESCNNLTSITIPNNVTSIGEGAFISCTNLVNVSLGTGIIAIGDYAFKYCASLAGIILPDSVTSLGERVFEGCTSLASATLGNSLTNLPDFTFHECTNLSSITIPDSITSIGYMVFGDCNNLEELSIPKSVDTIATGAFVDANNLINIDVDLNNNSYISQDGILFNKSMTTIIKYPSGNTRTEYEIPNSVLTIDYHCFEYSEDLENVVIPDSVELIERSAFADCTNLQSIDLKNVRSILHNAYENCSSLTSIVIPDTVISLDNSVFKDCTSLTSVQLSNSLTEIPNSAFENCTSLPTITIPNGVELIRGSAFMNCSSLTSITIPSSVTSIDSTLVFYNCHSNLIIYGYAGSYAETYAASNGIPFVAIVLSSSTYTIDQDNSIVSAVSDLTSIADFKASFNNETTHVKVYNSSGTEVTTGNVGTGMTVKLVIDGIVEDELEVCVLGDVNSDGVIDISDYTYVRLKIFELRDLTGVYFMAGDVNKDGSIDISDYTYVRLDIFDLRPIN